MPYQSFEKGEGNSKSKQKYESLKLNSTLLKDAAVLDIGCNEGYFCFKAAELGAKVVTGIDKSNKWINLARCRNSYNNVFFVESSLCYLDTIEPESIDIIFLLSAMHYMTDPENINSNGVPRIFSKISTLLKKGGLFIFEGGVEMNDESDSFIQVKRSIGDTVYHPTKNKMQNILTSTFSSYKYIGESVKQGGDPISRYVYYGIK